MIKNFQFEGSSMLSDCSYDTSERELNVTFSNGKTYTYTDVDQSVYDDLTNAPSAGRYFNSIKAGLTQKQPA